MRIRRYCDPKVKKKITASSQVLKLYASEDGRSLFVDIWWSGDCHWGYAETKCNHIWSIIILVSFSWWGAQLRQLLEKHGDFKNVELQITRWNKSYNQTGNKGKWVTKAYLKDQEKYTSHLVTTHFIFWNLNWLLYLLSCAHMCDFYHVCNVAYDTESLKVNDRTVISVGGWAGFDTKEPHPWRRWSPVDFGRFL